MKSAPNDPEQLKRVYLVLAGDQAGYGAPPQRRLLPLLLARWKLIAIASLGFFIAARTYCLLAAPVYRAQVLLSAVEQEVGSPTLGALAGILVGAFIVFGRRPDGTAKPPA
jgi:hypothetical protein